MSRLDSFIRRVTAQRDILNSLAQSSTLPGNGDIVELGLGNGRTYSHLRELFPTRRILVFDRVMQAHASCIPADEDLVLGEIDEVAREFAGLGAAMVHADIGTGSDAKDAVTLTWLPELVVSLLAPNGIAASGLPLQQAQLVAQPLPDGIDPDRYFIYQKRA